MENSKNQPQKGKLITGVDKTPEPLKTPVVRGTLMFNGVAVTTHTRSKNSLIHTGLDKSNNVLPIQTVVAKGPMASDSIKVGDVVLIDWSGFSRSKVDPTMLSVKDPKNKLDPEQEPTAIITDRLILYVFAEGEQDQI